MLVHRPVDLVALRDCLWLWGSLRRRRAREIEDPRRGRRLDLIAAVVTNPVADLLEGVIKNE